MSKIGSTPVFRPSPTLLARHRFRSVGRGGARRAFYHLGVHVSGNLQEAHSRSSTSISSRERLSPNLVDPLQARAFARSSPPASAPSAARSAASASETVSGALMRRTAPSPNGSNSKPRELSSASKFHASGARSSGRRTTTGAGSATGSALGFFSSLS